MNPHTREGGRGVRSELWVSDKLDFEKLFGSIFGFKFISKYFRNKQRKLKVKKVK